MRQINHISLKVAYCVDPSGGVSGIKGGLPVPSPVQAETVAELAAASGSDWIIGKWASANGNVSADYTWKPIKHGIGVTCKIGEEAPEASASGAFCPAGKANSTKVPQKVDE